MDPNRLVTHEEAFAGWTEIANSHRAALPSEWMVCKAFLELHQDAAKGLSESIGAHPSKPDRALLAVVTHSFTVFTSIVGHVMRGEFDVAVLLQRAHFDARSIAPGIAGDEQLAQAFLSSRRFEAGRVRQAIEANLREARGDEIADDYKRIMKDEAKALNALAHVNGEVATRSFLVDGDVVHPTVGGYEDLAQARGHLRAVFRNEIILLQGVSDFHPKATPPQWTTRFRSAAAQADALPQSQQMNRGRPR